MGLSGNIGTSMRMPVVSVSTGLTRHVITHVEAELVHVEPAACCGSCVAEKLWSNCCASPWSNLSRVLNV